MQKSVGVYKIENLVNGKIYIGSSSNIEQRFRRQRHELRNNKHWLKDFQNDWNKYGEDKFQFIILEIVKDKLELTAREQDWTDNFKSYETDKGYNKRKDVRNNLNIYHSENTKIKICESLKGRFTGEKNPMHKTNYKYNDETRSKMSESHKGINNFMYGKGYINEGERNGRAKLSKSDVLEIKNEIDLGIMIKDIAKKYNVASTTICRIRYGKAWSSLSK